MTEAELKQKLYELLQIISSFPKSASPKANPDGLYVSHKASDEQGVEHTADLLRLQIKYLLFDLEATRRENR